jgi:hypothetical protein
MIPLLDSTVYWSTGVLENTKTAAGCALNVISSADLKKAV